MWKKIFFSEIALEDIDNKKQGASCLEAVAEIILKGQARKKGLQPCR